MGEFIGGVASSLAAAGLIAAFVTWIYPTIRDKWFYQGVRVDGKWNVFSLRDGQEVQTGILTLTQKGAKVEGNSVRTKTRDGSDNFREFSYKGHITKDQLTLVFLDSHRKCAGWFEKRTRS